MANPMIQMLNRGAVNPAVQNNPAVNLYRAYKAARNPALALQEMMSNNPTLAQLQQFKNSGADMQQMFYSLCQSKGVDPQSVLAQFQ